MNVVLDFADPLDAVPTVGDGYRIVGHIVIARVEDAVKVPVGALFREGDGWAAFAVQGGHAAKRTLVIERRNGVEAQVRSGLAAGERVVVYPPDGLKDGARVAVLTP